MRGKNKEKSGRPRGFRTLTAKLLVSIGSVVTLVCVLAGIVIMSLVRTSISRLTSGELSAESQAAAKEIEGYFGRYYEISRQMAMSSQTEALIGDVRPGDQFREYQGLAPIVRTLQNIKKADSGSIMALWLVDFDSSQLVQLTDSGSEFSPEDWVVKGRPWYNPLVEAGQTMMTEPYEDMFTKAQVVSVISPVYASDGKEIVGAAGIDFTLDALVETVGGYRLRDTGFYLLTSASGVVIYHPVAENINRPLAETDLSSNIREALLSHSEGSMVYTSHGVRSHGYLTPVGDTGWMIATGLPAAEFNRDY